MTGNQRKAMQEQYALLILRGYHPRAARRIVCEKAGQILGRPVRRFGMGQEEEGDNILVKAAALEPIKAAREMVSPWLWVTSLIGFGLAILNTRRIAKMYKNWRAKRAKATA